MCSACRHVHTPISRRAFRPVFMPLGARSYASDPRHWLGWVRGAEGASTSHAVRPPAPDPQAMTPRNQLTQNGKSRTPRSA